jgi:hypothetical protein
MPIAAPRSFSSYAAPISASEHGTSSAAPIPCSTRAPISTGTLGERPHTSDAAANTNTPITNTRRRPNWSAAAPPTSSSADMHSV